MAPVLLGLAVGERIRAGYRPAEAGVEILWVDYDAPISLHRVITTMPKERRAQRLASQTPLDNRISYGCYR